MKAAAISHLKGTIKESLKQIDAINSTMSDNNQNPACLSKADMAEIELSLQSPGKNFDLKGSRFTHSEKLQFTKVIIQIYVNCNSLANFNIKSLQFFFAGGI